MKRNLLFMALLLSTLLGRGQIAAWDFFGQSSPSTFAATTFNSFLVSSSGANLITRGSGAAASTASNSFRTTGFQNNGISTSNTDYFQITLTAQTGYKLSLSTIDARFAGTSTFYASPGVTSQFAYSLNGSSFNLIGSPALSTSLTLTQISLSGISALQDVPAGTTVTLRYYASGQTATGGWGFNSLSAGTNGLAIGGSIVPTTLKGEPGNHVTNFFVSQGDPSTSVIDGIWDDATGDIVPDYYLIKGSSVSFDDIAVPEDFIAEADALLVKNVAAGTETVSFTGLAPNTTYYFRIFPYTNSGVNCNYKTDGELPESSASTAISAYGLQLSATNTAFVIDFDNTVAGVNNGPFAGTGFQPSPSSGQLDSDAWSVAGVSDGTLYFGGTMTSGDFARGTSVGGVPTGGIYSFTVQTGNRGLGVQPTATDFTPGSIYLKSQNQTGEEITSLLISYKVYIRNDQPRSNSVFFAHSPDDATYTDVLDLDLSSPATSTGSSWLCYYRNYLISGLNLENGGQYYFLWDYNDYTGSDDRDEFALDDITVIANPSTTFAQIGGNVADMVILGNTTASNDLTVNGPLNIPEGASLTVAPGKKLSVSGTTTLNAAQCLVLQSDADGQATFIDNGTITGSGSARIEQYLTGANAGGNPNGRYYYVGSPVSGALSNVYDAAGDNRLWSWSEPGQSYTEIINNTTSLGTQTGYVARLSETTTCSYIGTPSTGTKTLISLPRTGSTSSTRGFHLLSNPYPSGLDWGQVSRSNLYPTLWYRTANAGNTMVFDTYNASNSTGTNNNGGGAVTAFIRPMQAFWVRVEGDGNQGSLSFNNSMRSHQMSGPKSTGQSRDVLRVYASAGDNRDEAILLFAGQATEGFTDWDSDKMFANANGLPEIYTIVPGHDAVVINSLPLLDAPRDIPLGFKTTQAGDFHLSVNTAGFNNATLILLEDTELNTFTNLRNSAYAFSSPATNTTTRFILHLAPSVLSGTVKYDNPAKTPLPGVEVELVPQDPATPATVVTTDENGGFRLPALPQGSYTLRASSTQPAFGFNANDALLALQHFAEIQALNGLRLQAADTDGSGNVNAIDALLIQKRFVGLISTFPAGDWLFEPKTFTISGEGQSQTVNLKGLCFGDAVN